MFSTLNWLNWLICWKILSFAILDVLYKKNPIVTLELKEMNFHDFRHTNVN